MLGKRFAKEAMSLRSKAREGIAKHAEVFGRKQTESQLLLAIHLKDLGVKTIPEYRFCDRMFRFDLAAPDIRMAWEISGGNWSGGHRRGKQQENEYDKLNIAQLLGWRVMQFTPAQVLDGRAYDFLRKYFA